MKREKQFKEIAAKVNTVRLENLDSIFSTEEMRILLRGILPTDCTARVELVKSNIIIRVKRGQYCFPKNPVYWQCIRNFYQQCRERSSRYRNGSKSLSNSAILDMIEQLKANGYVVYKRM